MTSGIGRFERERKLTIEARETNRSRDNGVNDARPALVLMTRRKPFSYDLSRRLYERRVITARTLNSRERRKGSRSKGRA